jgi:hypothetical protein
VVLLVRIYDLGSASSALFRLCWKMNEPRLNFSTVLLQSLHELCCRLLSVLVNRVYSIASFEVGYVSGETPPQFNPLGPQIIKSVHDCSSEPWRPDDREHTGKPHDAIPHRGRYERRRTESGARKQQRRALTGMADSWTPQKVASYYRASRAPGEVRMRHLERRYDIRGVRADVSPGDTVKGG